MEMEDTYSNRFCITIFWKIWLNYDQWHYGETREGPKIKWKKKRGTTFKAAS